MTDGATEVPEWQKPANSDVCKPAASDREFQHNWVWVWKNGHITNKVRCMRCGEIRQQGE